MTKKCKVTESFSKKAYSEFIGKVVHENYRFAYHPEDCTKIACIYKGKIVGMCLVNHEIKKNYYLSALYVLEQYRRKGFAEAILNYVLEHYDNTFFYVKQDNPGAIKFYKNFGCTLLLERKENRLYKLTN